MYECCNGLQTNAATPKYVTNKQIQQNTKQTRMCSTQLNPTIFTFRSLNSATHIRRRPCYFEENPQILSIIFFPPVTWLLTVLGPIGNL